MTPREALLRAIYYLDRDLAPSAKVRAFQKAMATVDAHEPDDLERRARAGTLTELDGIGKSSAEVIADSLAGRTDGYLARLDDRTRVEATVGADLREALRGDCHLHSTWSDGAASPEAMAAAAMALGHEYIVLTDHSARLTVAHGLSEERLEKQLADVAALNETVAPFRVLTGIEVDIFEDGSLDLADHMLAQLDVVVASVHSKLRLPAAEMTRRMVMAVANPHVDILGHCTNRKVTGTGRAPSEFDADMVFAACEKFDTAVEINCRPERQDPPEDLLALAIEWGCRVAIDSDAHAPGQLEWQVYGCDKAARAGIEPDDVINTRSADELVALLA